MKERVEILYPNNIELHTKCSLLEKVSGLLRPDFCEEVKVLTGASNGKPIDHPLIERDIPMILEHYISFNILSYSDILDKFVYEIHRCKFWNDPINMGLVDGETFHFYNWKRHELAPPSTLDTIDEMIWSFVNRYYPFNNEMSYPFYKTTKIRPIENTHLNDKRLKNFMKGE